TKIHQHLTHKFNIDRPLGRMTDRAAYRFADQSARASITILSRGRVCNGWEEMDDFVNSVLQRVIPEELRAKESVRAYLRIRYSNQ
ncbi:MAG: hypothetical protein OTI34_13695, partial [Lewinella sp.]|nr:hypothetical protein [Lewinella sp.]